MSRRDFARLFKFPVSIMSTVSAATGFVAFAHAVTWRLLPTSCAILLLAGAACALNEAQEYKLDATMDRTRLRPIPAGKISPIGAAAWSTILVLFALTTLFFLGGAVAVGLGAQHTNRVAALFAHLLDQIQNALHQRLRGRIG